MLHRTGYIDNFKSDVGLQEFYKLSKSDVS